MNEIDIKEVPKRFLRNMQNVYANEKIEFKEDVESRHSKDYSTLMARIFPFASIDHKNQKVAKLFEQFFDEVNELKKSKNQGMPQFILQEGCFEKSHSKNVILGGKHKEKKIYKCSICHQSGHNAKECPKKIIHENSDN